MFRAISKTLSSSKSTISKVFSSGSWSGSFLGSSREELAEDGAGFIVDHITDISGNKLSGLNAQSDPITINSDEVPPPTEEITASDVIPLDKLTKGLADVVPLDNVAQDLTSVLHDLKTTVVDTIPKNLPATAVPDLPPLPVAFLLLNLVTWFSKLGLLITYTPPDIWPESWYISFSGLLRFFATLGIHEILFIPFEWSSGWMEGDLGVESDYNTLRPLLILGVFICVSIGIFLFGYRAHLSETRESPTDKRVGVKKASTNESDGQIPRIEADSEPRKAAPKHLQVFSLQCQENFVRYWFDRALAYDKCERHRKDVEEEERATDNHYRGHYVTPLRKPRAKVRWVAADSGVNEQPNEASKNADGNNIVNDDNDAEGVSEQPKLPTPGTTHEGWISLGSNFVKLVEEDADKNKKPAEEETIFNAKTLCIKHAHLCAREEIALDSGICKFYPKQDAVVEVLEQKNLFITKESEQLFANPEDVGCIVHTGCASLGPKGKQYGYTVKSLTSGKETYQRVRHGELQFFDFVRYDFNKTEEENKECLKTQHMHTRYFEKYPLIHSSKRYSLVDYLCVPSVVTKAILVRLVPRLLKRKMVTQMTMWQWMTWYADRGTYVHQVLEAILPAFLFLILAVFALESLFVSVVATSIFIGVVLDFGRNWLLRKYWDGIHSFDQQNSERSNRMLVLNGMRAQRRAADKYWKFVPKVEIGLFLFAGQALYIPILRSALDLVCLWIKGHGTSSDGGSRSDAGVGVQANRETALVTGVSRLLSTTQSSADVTKSNYLIHLVVGTIFSLFIPVSLIWTIRRLRHPKTGACYAKTLRGSYRGSVSFSSWNQMQKLRRFVSRLKRSCSSKKSRSSGSEQSIDALESVKVILKAAHKPLDEDGFANSKEDNQISKVDKMEGEFGGAKNPNHARETQAPNDAMETQATDRQAKTGDPQVKTGDPKLKKERKLTIDFAQHREFLIFESGLFTAAVVLCAAKQGSDVANFFLQLWLALGISSLNMIILAVCRVFSDVRANQAELLAKSTLVIHQILLVWHIESINSDELEDYVSKLDNPATDATTTNTPLQLNTLGTTTSSQTATTTAVPGNDSVFSENATIAQKLRAVIASSSVLLIDTMYRLEPVKQYVALRTFIRVTIAKMRVGRLTAESAKNLRGLEKWTGTELEFLSQDQKGWLVTYQLQNFIGRFEVLNFEAAEGQDGHSDDAPESFKMISEEEQKRRKRLKRELDREKTRKGVDRVEGKGVKSVEGRLDDVLTPPLRVLRLHNSMGLLEMPKCLEECKNLEQLSFSECNNLEGKIVDFGKCPKLKGVDLNFCGKLYDQVGGFEAPKNIDCPATHHHDDKYEPTEPNRQHAHVKCQTTEPNVQYYSTAEAAYSQDQDKCLGKLTDLAEEVFVDNRVCVTKEYVRSRRENSSQKQTDDESDDSNGGDDEYGNCANRIMSHLHGKGWVRSSDVTPHVNHVVNNVSNMRSTKIEPMDTRDEFLVEDGGHRQDEEEEEENPDSYRGFSNFNENVIKERWPHIEKFRWNPITETE